MQTAAKPATLAASMEAVRTSLGMSQAEMERVTGIPADTMRRWVQGQREPSPRMRGVWLAAMEPLVRRRAPDLDRLLDPIRESLGREPATGPDLAAVTTHDAVPPADAEAARYGLRLPDGRTAVCEARDVVAGHLHAVRWRSRTGTTAGVYRVTPTGRTTVTLTQDDRPGDVLLVRTDQLDRCDPVVAIVEHLLPEAT